MSEFGDVSSDLSQVDPMTDPIALKQNWLWLILAAVCIAAVSIALAYWLLNRRQTMTVVVPTLSPEDVAHRALAELIAEELPSRGMVKEFYLRLTGIVRVFIEGKTGLRAPEQTTEEFLRDMRASSRFDGQQAFRLQEFLTAADLVKYAGQTPDESSIMHSLERAREFIAIRFQDPNEHHQPIRRQRGIMVESFRFQSWVFLFAIPIVIGVLLWSQRQSSRPRIVYSSLNGLERCPVSFMMRLRRFLPWLSGLGLVLLTIGIARPQWGKSESRISGDGIAIQLAIDISVLWRRSIFKFVMKMSID